MGPGAARSRSSASLCLLSAHEGQGIAVMAVAFYMDVHVPQPISDQLRRRSVDVLTAIQDGHAEARDEVLLLRATMLSRLLFTQDIRFKAMAEEWQRQSTSFPGLLFGHQL